MVVSAIDVIVLGEEGVEALDEDKVAAKEIRDTLNDTEGVDPTKILLRRHGRN